MAIAMLCIAFTSMLTIFLTPFLGDLFVVKSHMALYQPLFAEEMRELYQELPVEQRLQIEDSYRQLEAKLQQPWSVKLQRSAELLLFQQAPWIQGWLLLAIAIPILLLLRREEATQVAWLLPLLTLLYAVDCHYFGSIDSNKYGDLFPAEEKLVAEYLNEPLSSDIGMQYQQLLQGWQRYLIVEWAKEMPAEEPASFAAQLARGNFAFALARLPTREVIGRLQKDGRRLRKEPLPLLLLYLLANGAFALVAQRARPCCL